ncbi:MAG: CRISPR-associated endonuclease Cas2 [Candidatus Marinimicrobia bacterium CG08_land_8_20_14_0_20_45_22]|nr:MAG: CRISPR-associated endonuclease Cas2 [Candidatus Marinimicrobia bacterium CG08_land_8_20_14_0_20_45_22]
MYYIFVYDVGQKRVGKIHKFLKKYLFWIQNSVFEGELTEGTLAEVIAGLKKRIKKEADSIIIFELGERSYRSKQIVGIEKSQVGNFI